MDKFVIKIIKINKTRRIYILQKTIEPECVRDDF